MISRIFIERPKLAFVISIVTVLAGAICIFRLPVAEYPEIAPPSIMVSASYPGASAEVIANTVATVVEEQVNGIEGMIYFSSTSSNAGSYSLTITFEPGTDTDIAQVNVQNAVRRAEPSLPSEVKALGINIKKRSSDILAMYSFTTDGSTLSDLELSNWVRMNVRDGLSRIDGISDAEIMGVRNYSMRICSIRCACRRSASRRRTSPPRSRTRTCRPRWALSARSMRTIICSSRSIRSDA